MGSPSPMRALAPKLLPGAVLALLVLPAGGVAGVAPEYTAPAAEVTTTGNSSELLNAIPISKKPATRERVAMSIGPQRMEPIEVGDRMRVSAEIQFSTTCVKPGPRCVGSSYAYNPRVSARIVLASSPEVGAPSFALSTTAKRMC